MKAVNFLLVGVGGQGTLLASNVLADVGLAAGFEVKKSEVHGMAQRGGSVSSHVRWGERVYSPLIGQGEVDILISLERLETLRYVNMLRPGSQVVINDYAIVPMTVTAGDAVYPDTPTILNALCQATPHVTLAPGVEMAQELGNARANNIVILGAVSRLLDVDAAVWQDVIAARVPARYRDLNLRAFERGRAYQAG